MSETPSLPAWYNGTINLAQRCKLPKVPPPFSHQNNLDLLYSRLVSLSDRLKNVFSLDEGGKGRWRLQSQERLLWGGGQPGWFPKYNGHLLRPHRSWSFKFQFCDWEDLVFDRTIVKSTVVEDYQLICGRFVFQQSFITLVIDCHYH